MKAFYLRYVRSELLRRRARTILTLLGLAVGVALVLVIIGVSRASPSPADRGRKVSRSSRVFPIDKSIGFAPLRAVCITAHANDLHADVDATPPFDHVLDSVKK